ncbi:MAG TPA: universal stress protein [Jatrophihabitantaceae bacterium]|nr:universal stress protein [Jatrophihabitantaceae bacterium]
MNAQAVIVGVDGSPRSDAAVVWAADEAATRNAHMLIVHALDTNGMGLWSTSRAMREDLRQVTEPLVDRGIALVHDRQPAVVVRGRVLVGSPTRILTLLSHNAQLVVVGRDGCGAFEWPWLGNLPERLLAHATCPAVAAGALVSAAPRHHVDRVVVGCANDEIDAATLQWGFEYAAAHDVPLLAVHAVHQPAGFVLPAATASGYDVAVIEAERDLDKAIDEWSEQYPSVDVTRLARTGPAREVVVAACGTHDLLVLGHHHHTALAPRQLGVHATGVLRAATCSVVVVHPSRIRAEHAE